ncbi:uncharacterized protein FOMMEDRAFT_163722 [Fomitiporia mediterranea MF3/22]|uniref:Uncharacterized protein n=1 Tax=Fomitiporia mediterranea (strain MF3/22) TaxID=694068 RepID=R7SG26_FOMME|nr:uncharacterized protein FOMMEDRAFT_163722 [Fomitiporia mediterranea MF3/22]EJC97370.1 hypothetical protein FOMMEDRAFT_163722 [Fomitiporia mediterranea MF3/22]
MASLAAQISLFNAPDPNLGAPLTLAARCHGTASASTTCSTSIHTRMQFNLQGPSDDQSVVMKTTSNGPRTHPSSSVADAVGKRTRQRQLIIHYKYSNLTRSPPIVHCMAARSDIRTRRAVACAKWRWQTLVILRWVMRCACKDGSTTDAVITVEPLNALAFGWSVWIWSRDGPGNRHP